MLLERCRELYGRLESAAVVGVETFREAVAETARKGDAEFIRRDVGSRFRRFPVKQMPYDPTNPSDGRMDVDDGGGVTREARRIAEELGIPEGSLYYRVIAAAVRCVAVAERADLFDVAHFERQLLRLCTMAADAENPMLVPPPLLPSRLPARPPPLLPSRPSVFVMPSTFFDDTGAFQPLS